MAEQELDGAYIRALLQQVNGKGVAEAVWSNGFG
jgi:hypothetical protein